HLQPNARVAILCKCNDGHCLLVRLSFFGVISRFHLTVVGTPRRYVRGTANASAAAVQDVRVDHGRTNVLVSQEFLDRANVVAGGQEVCGKGMPKRVACRAFRESRRGYSSCYRFLDQGFVDGMTALSPSRRVPPATLFREYELPAPFSIGIGVLMGQGMW